MLQVCQFINWKFVCESLLHVRCSLYKDISRKCLQVTLKTVVRTMPDVEFVKELLWCRVCCLQLRGQVQLQQALPWRPAAATAPLGHGWFPRDGRAQFNLGLIWDFKWWLLYWRKSLPARCLATHLSRSTSLTERLCNFPWIKTLPVSPFWQQSTWFFRALLQNKVAVTRK